MGKKIKPPFEHMHPFEHISRVVLTLTEKSSWFISKVKIQWIHMGSQKKLLCYGVMGVLIPKNKKHFCLHKKWLITIFLLGEKSSWFA